ncbi:MAG: 3-dehydroquinate synthase [Candidatus Bathyarchaeota archaeon]|nr:3-dehydroquinate synthase [Candidatus Bathyarchaeota archaeon]
MVEVLRLNLNRVVNESYDILVGFGLFDRIPADLRDNPIGKRYAVITDSALKDVYGKRLLEELRDEGIDACLIDFPAGEESKNINTVIYIVKRLLECKIDRRSAVITLGGGVVGDVGGFAAAIYMRGIPYIQVPTTLLAQVDSSIGGKTAVDTEEGKNLIGSFHQPKRVYVDPSLLKTLPKREYLSGLAEVIKYGVIYDRNLFEYLEGNVEKIKNLDEEALLHIIKRSCMIKKEIVEEDPLEENKRSILNYGHTPAHAIERLSGYKCLHGEAVSVGMRISGWIAVKKGFWIMDEWERQNELLHSYGLPLKMDFNVDDLVRALYYDKKVEGGTLMFVLPKRIGEMASVNGRYRIPVPEEEVRRFLLELKNDY